MKLCFHKWSGWGAADIYFGFMVYQRRSCKKCGLVQQREVGRGMAR